MTLRPFAKDFDTGFGMGGDTVGDYGESEYGSGSKGSSGRKPRASRISKAQRRLDDLTSGTNHSTTGHTDLELDLRTRNPSYHNSLTGKPKSWTVQEFYLGEHGIGRSPPTSPGVEENEANDVQIGNTTTIIYSSPSPHGIATGSGFGGYGRHHMTSTRGVDNSNTPTPHPDDTITVTHLVEQKVRPRNMV